jgi:hypothetical protein
MSGNPAQVNAAIANKIVLTDFVPIFSQICAAVPRVVELTKKRHLLAPIGVTHVHYAKLHQINEYVS